MPGFGGGYGKLLFGGGGFPAGGLLKTLSGLLQCFSDSRVIESSFVPGGSGHVGGCGLDVLRQLLLTLLGSGELILCRRKLITEVSLESGGCLFDFFE